MQVKKKTENGNTKLTIMPILPILCVREKPDREIKDLVIGNGVSAFKLSLN